MDAAAKDAPLALDDGGPHQLTDWVSAAAGVLRKAGRLSEEDPDERVWDELTGHTLDGVEVSPLGTPELVADLATTGRPTRVGAWDVRSRLVLADDPAATRSAALEDLEGGVTSLWLELPEPADLAALLEGVLLDVAPVVLDAPSWGAEAARALVELAGGTTLHPATNLGADPLGARLRGAAGAGDDLDEVAAAAAEAGVRGVVVDATAVHDLGASDAQELGYSLAAGAAYLRRLTASGLDLATALGLLEFRYAATDEQLLTIAKLRAARRVWARVVELSSDEDGGDDAVQRQHVVTSRPMMGKYDPWVNMLRTTVAAFSAGVGGADAVTVLPFDAPLGRPDAMARRIARNTSALLIEESHVAVVTDPAGGSYAVERLTDDLAKAAWAELDAIESAGGIEALLEAGDYLPRLEATVRERERQVATRERPLTGISEFPDLHQRLPEREPDPAERPVRRWGADFEALRDEPAGSPVFLATMGSVASHTARATYAANLLAAGGVDVVRAGATDDTEAVLAAYAAEKSPAVVCLAGHDRAYAEWGPALVAALREAGASWVVVAGRATVKGTDLRVDDACATGDDALAFLTTTREHLR